MDEILQKMKKLLINKGKRMVKIFLPIIIVVIIISGSVYVIKKFDGTYKEGDWANTQYAAGQYTGNVSIDPSGNISTNMTAQELWDKLISEGSRVDLYLDGPEELLRLMNAEIVTNYPDLRENPDDEIDWNEINKKIDSTEVQGIIKFKRAQSNGNISTMSYVNSDTFYNWIEEYCSTGDETARQNVLTHFTIEQNMAMGTGAIDNFEYNGKDTITDISARIVAAAKITPWYAPNRCQGWVRRVYANAGLGDVGYATAFEAYKANVVSTDWNNIPVGAAVYGTGSTYAGHVGIYIGNGQVMDSINDRVRTQPLEEWIKWQEAKGNVLDGRVGWLGWGWQAGSPTNIISTGEVEKQYDENDDESDEDILNVDMQLITDNGKVTFYNGDGSAMEGGKLNAIGYELSEGQVAMKNLQEYKNCVIYIETAENGEGSYANGKFFYVTDTGGGLADNQVDVYADVEQSKLNAAPYGSYTSGAKIYLVESNVTLDDYNSKYLDKEIGEVDSGTTQNQNAYSVVVATWSKTQVIVESDDPQVEESNNTTLSMTTQKINYQDFVSGYTMPFDYLWDFLVLTEDKDFVFDLAELVYDSEIEITIHDNLNVHTKKEIYNYDRRERVLTTNVEGSITYHSNNTSGAAASQGNQVKTFSKSSGFKAVDYPHPYQTIKTTITTTNTLDISLTKADVWIVKYEKKYEYQGQQLGTEQSGGAQALANVDYGDPEVIHTDRNGDGAATLQSEQSILISQGNTIVSSNVNTTCNVWYGVFDITEEITNKTDTTKYISSPATIEEKTDKNATEPNFVTILLDDDNLQARRYILDASSWLFDLLAGNEKTADMVDLTKYLLYKALGLDTGVTEFDFNVYDPANFNPIATGGAEGGLSLTTTMFTKDVFIQALQAYYNKTGNQAFYNNFLLKADELYNSAVANNVNPELVVITAKTEGNFSEAGGSYNYWGLNVPNGAASGDSFSSLSEGVAAYARYIQKYETGSFAATIMQRYEERKAAGCDPLGYGLPGTLSGMQSIYSFLGKHEYGSAGAGGYYYMDPARAGVTKIYATHEEFVQKCLNGGPEHAAGTTTTVWEQGQYTAWQVEKKLEVWNDIFGDFGSLSSAGATGIGATVVEEARRQLGVPYVWGGEDTSGFDCSGLTMWCYNKAGISIPRTSAKQKTGAKRIVPVSEARVGDVLWKEGHVGIYIGNNEYIHAPRTGDVVKRVSGAVSYFTWALQFY